MHQLLAVIDKELLICYITIKMVMNILTLILNTSANFLLIYKMHDFQDGTILVGIQNRTFFFYSYTAGKFTKPIQLIFSIGFDSYYSYLVYLLILKLLIVEII